VLAALAWNGCNEGRRVEVGPSLNTRESPLSGAREVRRKERAGAQLREQ